MEVCQEASKELPFEKRPSNIDDCYFGRQCRKPGCWYLHPEGRLMDEEQAMRTEQKEQRDQKLSKLINICKPCEKSQPPEPLLPKPQKVKRRYRKNVCKKEMSAALAAFRSTKDTKQALLDIAAIAVPPSKQAEELADMLGLMMKEDS